MQYKPGEKVVCVDGNFDTTQPRFAEFFNNLPVEKVTYTIREVRPLEKGLLLEEVVNPEVRTMRNGILVWVESGFAMRRFAPLLTDRDEFSDYILEQVSKEIETERVLDPEWYVPEEVEEFEELS